MNSADDARRNDLVVEASTGVVCVGSEVRFIPHGVLPPDIPTEVLTLREVRDMRTGYFWHDFAGAVFADRRCWLSVCTLGVTIVHIQIKFRREGQKGPGWTDHSAVLGDIALGRAAFAAMLGKSFATGEERFPWGSPGLSTTTNRAAFPQSGCGTT